MPAVSVIVPNYNHAQFLPRRLDSILGQTFGDFELIYLDDASTDNSDRVIASFLEDRRIRVIRNTINSGNAFKQWNRGVREALGDYIWIAEADDSAEPTLLSRLVPLLDQNPQVGIAYCQSMEVDGSDRILRSFDCWTADLDQERWRHDFIASGPEECAQYLVVKNTIPNASAVLFRRSVFEQTGGAVESMTLCGDWITWVRMLLVSDLAFVGEPLNYFRSHAGSVRAVEQSNVLLLEQCQVIGFILKHCPVLLEKKNQVLADLRKTWMSNLYFRGLRRFLRHGKAIFRLAWQADRFLAWKVVINIVQTILFECWKKVGAKFNIHPRKWRDDFLASWKTH
jgi:glycosyltransferase involved in cell wall biosynthesis